MRVSEIRAHPDALDVLFALDPGDPVRTSDAPGLVEALTACTPGLRRHRCTSPSSGFLVSELDDTEIAHLFEHVTLELMSLAGASRQFAGRTDWDFARDGQGVYRVRFDCDDVVVAEAAVREALILLTTLVGGADPPSADSVAARIATS